MLTKKLASKLQMKRLERIKLSERYLTDTLLMFFTNKAVEVAI